MKTEAFAFVFFVIFFMNDYGVWGSGMNDQGFGVEVLGSVVNQGTGIERF